jgi:hypothetical protein
MDALALSYPTLHCPFPTHANPAGDQAAHAAVEWALSHGLHPDPASLCWDPELPESWLGALTHPDAPFDALVIQSYYLMWLFLLDDLWCLESATEGVSASFCRVLNHCLAALEEPELRGQRLEPIATALADIVHKLQDVGEDLRAQRFAAAVRGYLLAQPWEAAGRTHAAPPTEEDYRLLRRYNGGVAGCFELVKLGEAPPLPPEWYRHRTVRALFTAGVNTIGWSNDIYSYAKESFEGGRNHSYVSVIRHHEKRDLQSALQRVAAIHDQEVRAFIHARDRLLPSAPAVLRAHLRGWESWMSGNITWSLLTLRYKPHPNLVCQTDIALDLCPVEGPWR